MLLFDIGANIGSWAIANRGRGTIVSVEASGSTFATLQKNVAPYTNITPLHYAICNSSEPFVTFYECTTSTISTLNENWLAHPSSRFYNSKYHAIQSPVCSLDKLIADYGVPDLLKIDVEGGEYSCIQSLTQKVPVLCFEWASEVNPITFQCIDYLVSLGFSSFFLQHGDNYTFQPSTFPLSAEELQTQLRQTKLKVDWGMIWCK